MKADIKPGKVKGFIEAPPSKSAAHRILIGCGLSQGECIADGILDSEDMKATMDCLRALGVSVEKDGNSAKIKGLTPEHFQNANVLNCRESGSTLRFFIPLCLLNGKEYTLTGSEKLFSRPLDVYEKICKEQGIKFELGKNELKLCGKLSSGVYEVRGDISSQFITGLMFAFACMNENCTIKLIPPVESRSYIDLSIRILNRFGIFVKYTDSNTILVNGNGKFMPNQYKVEGDYSNAAFFDVLNYMGSDVKVLNLDNDSVQGDKIYRQYFPMIEKNHSAIDLSDCPDLGPVLFALSAYKGGGRFTGVGRLRIKESDRIQSMADELAKFGAKVVDCIDYVDIVSNGLHCPSELLCAHNDHRIVMALSVLSTLTGGTIDGVEAVCKSFPDYFEKMKDLGFEVNCYAD